LNGSIAVPGTPLRITFIVSFSVAPCFHSRFTNAMPGIFASPFGP
jgi:hypothetical protein